MSHLASKQRHQCESLYVSFNLIKGNRGKTECQFPLGADWVEQSYDRATVNHFTNMHTLDKIVEIQSSRPSMPGCA